MTLTTCPYCQAADSLGKHVAHVCVDPTCTCTSCLEAKIRRRAHQRAEASRVAAGRGISR